MSRPVLATLSVTAIVVVLVLTVVAEAGAAPDWIRKFVGQRSAYLFCT